MQQAPADSVYTIGYSEDMPRFPGALRPAREPEFPGSPSEARAKTAGRWLCCRTFVAAAGRGHRPGELRGVDIEPSQIDLARAITAAADCSNAAFQIADVVDLPFEDGSFDVVHLGGVLMHVSDTARALAEVKRVLRTGGMVACRDIMLGSCFAHPELGVMQRSLEVFIDLVESDGGHPQIARDMKLHLWQAGFVDINISASFEVYDTTDELDFYYTIIRRWFLDGGVADAAIQCGALSPELMTKIAHQLEEWQRNPGAVAGMAFGHAIAVRPR